MNWLQQVDPHLLVVFATVLVRVSGLMITAPIFGAIEVPVQGRAMLAVAISLLLTPAQADHTMVEPENLVQLGIMACGELLVGLTLGLGVMFLFSGIHMAGQLISHVGGLSLAESFQPGLDSSVPLFSHLLYLITLAVFLIIGGHRLVMMALLETFTEIPLGSGNVSPDIVEAATNLITQSLVLGLRIAAPVTAAQLLATLVLGLVSRTLPQLNVLVLGFGINSLVTLSMMMFTIGGSIWVFESYIVDLTDPLFEMLHIPPLASF